MVTLAFAGARLLQHAAHLTARSSVTSPKMSASGIRAKKFCRGRQQEGTTRRALHTAPGWEEGAPACSRRELEPLHGLTSRNTTGALQAHSPAAKPSGMQSSSRLIQEAETIAQVALASNRGAKWPAGWGGTGCLAAKHG